MRAIDADDTEQMIRESYCDDCREGGKCGECMIEYAVEIVDGMPTVKLREKLTEKQPEKMKMPKAVVSHGKWEQIPTRTGRGTLYLHAACGKRVPIREDYCGRCGARMDG